MYPDIEIVLYFHFILYGNRVDRINARVPENENEAAVIAAELQWGQIFMGQTSWESW